MKSKIKHRILGLDVMRSLAILFVLIAHTCKYFLEGEIRKQCTYYFGYLGVELFFVLSGFLIGTILLDIYNKKQFSFYDIKQFWIRRWFRTIPNYILVLVVYFIVFYFKDSKLYFLDIKYLSYFFFLQNSITEHPTFFAPAWSLSIEEWFYIIMPLLLLTTTKLSQFKKKYNLLLGTLIIIFSCLILRIMLAVYTNNSWDSGFRKLMPLRLDAIAIGVLFAYIKFYNPTLWLKQKNFSFYSSLIFILLLSTVYFQDYLTTFEGSFFLKTIFFSIFSISIGLLLPFLSQYHSTHNNIATSFTTHLSITSYSIYLIHSLIIKFVDFNFNAPNFIKFSIIWILTISIANIQYFYFEKPTTDLRNIFTKK